MNATQVQTPARPSGRKAGRPLGATLVVAAAVASAFVIVFGDSVSIFHIVAGFFLAIVLPVALVDAKLNWSPSTQKHESLIYSLAFVLMALMLGGAVVSLALPLVGIDRPLDKLPLTVAVSVGLIALAAWRRDRWRPRDRRDAVSGSAVQTKLESRDRVLLSICGAVLIGAVAGPIRLNNGASGTVSVAALVIAAVALALLVIWRGRLQSVTIGISLYAVSFSLLLLTSLRGWFITGHDIQQEYGVFQETVAQGLWGIATLRSTYNSCLSITVLPTMMERLTSIPDVYVFKIGTQALFALCPVLIYMIARRFGSRLIAILAASFLLLFPTFYTDMPFLTRQEVALFFMAVALLLVSDPSVNTTRRRVGFAVLCLGVIVSHYSTMYVLIMVLAIGWLIARGARWIRGREVRNHSSRSGVPARGAITPTIVINGGLVLGLIALTFLWSVPLTQTAGPLSSTLESVTSALKGDSEGRRSSDISFLIPGLNNDPNRIFENYRAESIERTRDSRDRQETYPLAVTESYPTPVLPPEEMEPTAIGRTLENVGLDPAIVIKLLRLSSVLILPFMLLGLALGIMGRARGFIPSVEFSAQAVAVVVVVAMHATLPNLSTDYGVLRTVTQALFWLAPFLAVGSVQAFSWLGRRRAELVALAMVLTSFLSLTGVVPQILGGYPPQLALNNAGRQYDRYYFESQQISAIKWLTDRTRRDKAASIQAERFAALAFEAESPLRTTGDIYPALVQKKSYVLLGSSPVQKEETTFSLGGDTVAYHYPIEFLEQHKSLIYSSDGARIYR